MTKKRQQRVLVAMSGGVDSSVAAALLCQDKKYEVVGAFMKQWDEKVQNGEPKMQNVCTWKKDRRDALRVAAKLDIPLITLNFEKEYREWVMEYMFKEYEAGRTPNPDVLCNKYIKFGFWLSKVRELGFDYLATGHYARIFRNEQLTMNDEQQVGSNKLLNAKDKNKDQTYFLHQLNQKQLAHTLFPIGNYLKPAVRRLARRFDLPTAEREESMGICFVGEVPMTEFLKHRIKPKPGNIVTTSGDIVGEHQGLAFYTIGQRTGLQTSDFRLQGRISEVRGPKSEVTRPLYVVGKDMKKNQLIVGYEDNPALYKREIQVADVHWVAGREPGFPLKCEVRLRHRQPLQKCGIKNYKSGIMVTFDTSQRAVTPGQFAVFYKRGVCLGGGTING